MATDENSKPAIEQPEPQRMSQAAEESPGSRGPRGKPGPPGLPGPPGPPAPGDGWARFILIAVGIPILVFGSCQIAPRDRTATTSEDVHSTTASQARTAADETTVNVDSHRETTAKNPDGRPSDVALGLVLGFGALLVLGGAFFNRNFSFTGPGGFGFSVPEVKQIVTKTLENMKKKDPQVIERNPDAVGEAVAAVLHSASRPPILSRMRRRRRPTYPDLSYEATSPGDELDALINTKVDEVIARNRE